ncbi:hypothetical protein FGB62_97g18 [Gracilaria domingensis]|nr:hypothetical protein FGB62_97g18 [Gracilaria domingensis]
MDNSEHKDSAGVPRQILPKSLCISRDGSLHVVRRASVIDSETLYFLVPRRQMQRAIDSLQVSDSRGTVPRITFPASSFSPHKLNIRAEDAWTDLVQEQQGAYVQIFMGSDCAEGHLIGLRNHDEENGRKSSVLLLHDSQVSAYDIQTVTSLSFRDSSAAAALKKYTTSREFDMDTKEYYRVTITTTGSGTGNVSVSYSQIVSGVPFSISYSFSMPEGVPAYGIHPNMLLKCFATISNPLSCDLKNVEVLLQGQIYQNFPKKDMYEDAGDKGSDAGNDKSSGNEESSFQWTRKADSVSSGLSEVDEIFDTSNTYVSQASIEAHYDSCRKVLAKIVLSLKEGECARVPLFEVCCEGGLVHFYGLESKVCSLNFYIRNTSERDLEPGHGQFCAPDIESTSWIALGFLKKGDTDVSRFRQSTGCRGSSISESVMEKVTGCSKVGKTLVATVTFRRAVQYLFHNVEDRDIDILVYHKSRQSSRAEVESETKLYRDLKAVEFAEHERKSMVQTPRRLGFFTRMNDVIHVQACAKERCKLVVIEKVTRNVEIPLLQNVSAKRIANLEENNMIGGKTAEQLHEILHFEREIEMLSTRRSLHRKRIQALINHLSMEAEKKEDSEPISDGKEEKGSYEGSTYMRAVLRFEKERMELQKAVEDIERKMICLQHEAKSKKKMLIENQSLD